MCHFANYLAELTSAQTPRVRQQACHGPRARGGRGHARHHPLRAQRDTGKHASHRNPRRRRPCRKCVRRSHGPGLPNRSERIVLQWLITVSGLCSSDRRFCGRWLFRLLNRKRRPFTARSTLFPPETHGWKYLATRRRTAKDFIEVVGIHALLTRALFGDGILRRLLRCVSLAKSTSAPLRF
jgi:hypothetical protein